MPATKTLIARIISVLEGEPGAESQVEQIRRAVARSRHKVPVIGVTGTGGAGKSSLIDELLARLVRHFPPARSPSSRSTRPAAAPAARSWATASA